MASLTIDEILAADDLSRQEVDVPEWGGTVWLRVMTADERMKVTAETSLAEFVATCLCDESGAQLCTNGQAEALAEKNGDVMQRLATLALELNAMTERSEDNVVKI